MILDGELLNTCDSVLHRLNDNGYNFKRTINYSKKKDWDDYYFIIDDNEAIEIVISYGQSNWFVNKDIIEVVMSRPWVNVEKFDSSVRKSFDNRWLEIDSDILFHTLANFLEV